MDTGGEFDVLWSMMCSEDGSQLMLRNPSSFISGGDHICNINGTMSSLFGGEVILMVMKYKYLGCVLDDVLNLNGM